MVVFALHQDATGCVWAGTPNRLLRHDGREFRRFDLTPEPRRSQGLASCCRALIVDNKVNQRLAHALLEKRGIIVRIAANGKEAIDCWSTDKFDAILMDCQMPLTDGDEVTGEIRAREESLDRIPIIAMTAHAMSTDRERCLNAGMDDYITELLVVTQLDKVLKRWLPDRGVPQLAVGVEAERVSLVSYRCFR